MVDYDAALKMAREYPRHFLRLTAREKDFFTVSKLKITGLARLLHKSGRTMS
jgi:hypothetical protein